MPTISYPSAAFPGPPKVEVDLPDGWSGLRMGGVLMAAREVAAPTGFASNVVVRGYTRGAGDDVRLLVRELLDFVEEREDGQVDDPFEVSVNGTPMLGVNVSWHDPEIGTIIQCHLLAASLRGTVQDVVHVIGAIGGGDLQSSYTALQDVLGTVRISR